MELMFQKESDIKQYMQIKSKLYNELEDDKCYKKREDGGKV